MKEKKKTKKEKQEEVDKLRDYFKKKYDEDKENQKKQKWDDYWDWVKKFYLGTLLISGWLDRRDELLQNIGNDAKARIKKRIDELGETIGAEWAKDNSVRKINSDDLKKWGEQLKKAKKNDKGDGKELDKTIDDIEKAVNDRLKK